MIDFLLASATISIITYIVTQGSTYLLICIQLSKLYVRYIYVGVLLIYFGSEIYLLYKLYSKKGYYDYLYQLTNIQFYLNNKFSSIKHILTIIHDKTEQPKLEKRQSEYNSILLIKNENTKNDVYKHIEKMTGYLQDFDSELRENEKQTKIFYRRIRIAIIIVTILSYIWTAAGLASIYWVDFGIDSQYYLQLVMLLLMYDSLAFFRPLYIIARSDFIEKNFSNFVFKDQYEENMIDILNKLEIQFIEICSLLKMIDEVKYDYTIKEVYNFYDLEYTSNNNNQTMRFKELIKNTKELSQFETKRRKTFVQSENNNKK